MKLLEKLERLVDLMIAHYEKAANPLIAVPAAGGGETPEKAPPKPRGSRKAAVPPPPPAAVPTAPSDPLMQGGSNPPAAVAPSAAPSAAPAAVMTEEQSLAQARELPKRLSEVFDEMQERDGKRLPRGFFIALDLLAKHRVARVSDLMHAQRLQFIADAEQELAKIKTPAVV